MTLLGVATLRQKLTGACDMDYFNLVVGVVFFAFGVYGALGAPYAWSLGVDTGWGGPIMCVLMAVAGACLISQSL